MSDAVSHAGGLGVCLGERCRVPRGAAAGKGLGKGLAVDLVTLFIFLHFSLL